MKITWMGHACFLITAQDGRTLLTDPFGQTVGALPGVPANVVTCSHSHRGHHATDALPNGYTVIDQPGKHHTAGFVIEGVSCFHDDQQGLERGRNMVYIAQIDGLKVAHMGDLGHQPTEAMKEKLMDVDVMLIPVGGVLTLDGDEAAQAVETLNPRLVIPMHYRITRLSANLNDETAFVEHFDHEYVDTDTIEVTRDNLGDYPRVVVLTHKG